MEGSQTCHSHEELGRLSLKLRGCLWSPAMIKQSERSCKIALMRPDYLAARVRRRNWLMTACDIPLRLELVTVNHCYGVIRRRDQRIALYELHDLTWDERQKVLIFRFVQLLEIAFRVAALEVIHEPRARVLGVMPVRYLLHCIECTRFRDMKIEDVSTAL